MRRPDPEHSHLKRIANILSLAVERDPENQVFSLYMDEQRQYITQITNDFLRSDDGCFHNPRAGTAIKVFPGSMGTTGAVCLRHGENDALLAIGITGATRIAHRWLSADYIDSGFRVLHPGRAITDEDIDLAAFEYYLQLMLTFSGERF